MTVHFQVAEMASGSYLASSVLAMVSGGDFYLVRDTEVHALCGRSHRTLDRKQPIYELAGRVRREAEAKMIGTIELTTAGPPDYWIGDPNRVCCRRAMACATFLLTTSFVFTTPGITQRSPTGFPIISTLLEQFLLKDIALLAASFTLLLASLSP